MIVFNLKCTIFVCAFVYCVQEIAHAKESNYHANKCTHTFNSTLNKFENEFTKWTSDKSDSGSSFFSNIFENIYFRNVSSKCTDGLQMYMNDLLLLKPWALEMLDATGKPPSSFLLGTTMDLGSFDDCLKIRVNSENETLLFGGQFCMAHMQHPLFHPSSMFKTENGNNHVDTFGHPPDWIRDLVDGDISTRFGLYLGICTPSVCTEEDLRNIINSFAEPIDLNFTVNDCVSEMKNEPKKWSFVTKLSVVIISSFVILCAIGTSLDLFDRKQQAKQTDDGIKRELLKSFSIYLNAESLFTINPNKTPLDCLNGLRFMCCIWITVGHYLAYPTVWKELHYRNVHYAFEFLKPELLMIMINNGAIVVEVFFYLSGFFLVYASWEKIEQSGKISVLENILQRYRRFTPGHFFLILLPFTLPSMSSGPLWNTTWEHETTNCLRNGWKNILYLQNFNHHPSHMCWFHTWFIASTIHFIAIFTPLMVITYKYPKFGITICLIMLFGSMAYDYNTSIERGFMFCSYNHYRIPQKMADFGTAVYVRLSFHIPSNLVGMLSGWIVLKHRNRKLSRSSLITGWSFCAVFFAISLYGVHLPVTDPRIGALYIATRNTVCCLGLAWIVYACAAGYGGVLDNILSWKAFEPICRMSYSIYLVNPIIIVLRDAAVTERLYMDKISHVIEVIPYFIITFTFGFIFFITVEEPCNKVYEVLKKRYFSSNHALSESTHQTAVSKTACQEKRSKNVAEKN